MASPRLLLQHGPRNDGSYWLCGPPVPASSGKAGQAESAHATDYGTTTSRQNRAFSAQCGPYRYSGHVRHPAVDTRDGWRANDVISRQEPRAYPPFCSACSWLMICMWAALTWSFCAAAFAPGRAVCAPYMPPVWVVTELPADHGLKGNGLRSRVLASGPTCNCAVRGEPSWV
jgi:hypothetical protein